MQETKVQRKGYNVGNKGIKERIRSSKQRYKKGYDLGNKGIEERI